MDDVPLALPASDVAAFDSVLRSLSSLDSTRGFSSGTAETVCGGLGGVGGLLLWLCYLFASKGFHFFVRTKEPMGPISRLQGSSASMADVMSFESSA